MKIAPYVKTGLLWLGLACVPAFAAGAAVGTPAGDGTRVAKGARVPADGSAGEGVGHGGRLSKAHPIAIQRGVLTVDGLTVKTGLSLRVPAWRYMYVYLPGSGTALIAERPFAGAREERGAFRGKTLTVNAGGTRLQLTASNKMRGSRSAYVRFDRGLVDGVREPMVGFGDAALAPAVWSPDGGQLWNGKRRVRVSGRRLRTAKLCRPSAHGREMCATIREVVYQH